MKIIKFNLDNFRKQAYYDDAKGLMQSESRAWMNCYKTKVSAGVSPQEAINSCMEEYQKKNSNDWSMKYARKNKK
jgi:hypothetical protein